MNIRVILFFILISFQLSAQQPKSWKLGKATIEDYNLGSDQDDDAVIQYEIGTTSYDFYGSTPKKTTEFKIRIKILNDEGLDYANIEIPVRKSRQKIQGFKSNTYNLDANGNLAKSDEKAEKFVEEINEKYDLVKYTLPNVKIGSLIEYNYTIQSDYFYVLDRWYFQSEIPTLYSEYKLQLPEYITFHFNILGYQIMEQDDYKQEEVGDINHYSWIMRDVPAYISEEHAKPSVNYLSAIDFELHSIKFTSGTKYYSQTWDDICRDLMQGASFGQPLSNSFSTNDIVGSLELTNNPQEDLNTIFDFVKSFNWNGKYGMYVSKPLRRTLKDQSGNTADLNLLMINLLHLANIKAYPVILSTRNNGLAPMFYPSTSSFNYVVALAEIDGKQVFLDATSDYNQIGVLPRRCINGDGRVIKSANESAWISLVPKKSSKMVNSSNFTLHDDLSLTGVISKKRTKNNALNYRKYYSKFADSKEYETDVEESYSGLDITSSKVEHLDDPNQAFKQEWEVEIKDAVEQLDDLTLLYPVLYSGWDENPFTLENRTYPIDFSYPFENTYITNITIPDYLSLDEIPEVINISTPDKSCSFLYNVKVSGQTINVMARIKVKKAEHASQSYQTLKMFFNQIAEKISAPIILVKNEN